MKFWQKDSTKFFILGFIHAALLVFVIGNIPLFKTPYGYPQITCIQAPCFEARVSAFQYPHTVTVSEEYLRQQMDRLVEQNKELKEQLRK